MSDGKPQDRIERLKAALRENLKRRKVQARGRGVTEKPQTGDAVEPDASSKRQDR
jgi:hypothetical protein